LLDGRLAGWLAGGLAGWRAGRLAGGPADWLPAACVSWRVCLAAGYLYLCVSAVPRSARHVE